MNFQNEQLPAAAVKVGSTPSMTNETVVEGLLKNHLGPKDKLGFVVVEEGALQFVWEDSAEVLDANPDKPIVIVPERFHHIRLTEKVRFRVEFYKVPEEAPVHKKDERPGAAFA